MENEKFENEVLLLAALKLDSHEAFIQIFRKYYPDLVLFASRFIHDMETCEDIVQEAFINPFNVHTPYITVTAKGTEFNVNAYDSVTLVNGQVDVKVDEQSLHLNPAEHLTITDGKPVINDNIDTAKYCSWRNGMLIFEDESLLNICNRLQQMHDVEFDIAPELRTRTFRMILNGENISEIVHFFEMSAPVICEFVTPEAPVDTIGTKPKVRIMPS